MTKLFLALTATLILVSSSASALATGDKVQAAAPAEAQEIVFDYTQYQTPPLWSGENRIMQEGGNEDYIPISARPGGARGGFDHAHRRRFGKRAVIYDKNPHLGMNVNFEELNEQVDQSTGTPVQLEKRHVKRDFEDEDHDDDSGDDDDDDENNSDDDDDDEDDDEDEDEDDDEDDDEDEDGEVDEDEERRLDNEAGLQDWIEEMKSEEYFDLAGHPEGRGFDGMKDQYLQVGNQEDEAGNYDEEDVDYEMNYDEDEPFASEEEIFAASWHN